MSDSPSPINLNTPDVSGRAPGELLRAAREAQGLSLDHLAATLKVTPAKLAALEDGRLDQLPDAAFARALAQTMCRVLKIDAAAVLAEIAGLVESIERHPGLARSASARLHDLGYGRCPPRCARACRRLILSGCKRPAWLRRSCVRAPWGVPTCPA